jgi:cephalosporin-C deacetylase-like acetyl esterase
LKPLDLKLEYRWIDEEKLEVQTYSFVSEKGWRLKFTVRWNQSCKKAQPIILVLRNPGESGNPRDISEGFSAGIDKNVSIVHFEARGIGETGWAPEQQWHIRRAAAWTGRTVASMRVYDVLRCLEALRSLPGVDEQNINLASQGEMGAVALYASLLDKNINTLIVKNPPESQNIASQLDGRGEAIEMLNCLRITDLAQVAGALLPTKFVGIGKLPETYNWTKSVYDKIKPGHFQNINNISEWIYK